MSIEKITIKEKCRKCKGTGIAHSFWDVEHEVYCTGFQCPDCNGNGYTEYTYEPFEERERDANVKYVFMWPQVPNSLIDANNISANSAEHLLYSISYEEWLEGKTPPAWIESYHCPHEIFCTMPVFHEAPCSRCTKCLKKKKCYKSDKAYCWEEVRDRINNGETFPKLKK